MRRAEIDRRYDVTIAESGDLAFYEIREGWALGQCAAISPIQLLIPYSVDLRTFNANNLTERVNRAQRNKVPSYLHYFDEKFNKTPKQALILAARPIETDNGPIVRLWIALPEGETDYTHPPQYL